MSWKRASSSRGVRRAFGQLFGGTDPTRPADAWRSQPQLEKLEDRLAPVVGAFAEAYVVSRSMYEGVVDTNGCTGSLLYSGRHILTAAHCPLGANQALFQMARGPAAIDIPINIPAGAAFQTPHPSWNGDFRRGFDIAILRLVDQDTPLSNRHLVAPFGAERYELYRASNEIGRTYTVVGYGQTGTGATGEMGGGGVKRLAYNHFTTDGTGRQTLNPAFVLASDFDDGSAAYNRLNDPFWAGPCCEGMSAHGDSGGPLFLGNRIAGVNSWLEDWNPPSGFAGFSDVAVGTRVSSYAGWVDGQIGGNYHIVLDMNQQVFGNDLLVENLTITAQRNGANLELWVSGPSAAYSGLYYSGPAANILSLTIRGSNDYETINLEPGLGLNVTVQARGGNDTINVKGVSSGTLMTVDAGTNEDTINVGGGNPFVNLDGIQGALTLNGGAGTDTLVFNDLSTISAHTYTVGAGVLTRSGNPSPMHFSSVGTLVLNANVTNDIINVNSPDVTNVVINGGSGEDSIEVNGTILGTSVTVNGGLDDDSIRVNSTGGGSSLTINGGDGGDTIRVHATAVNSSLTVNAGDGDDHVALGVLVFVPAFGFTLDAIDGNVTVNGNGQGAMGDLLTFVDSVNAAASGRTYTLTGNTLARSGAALVTYGSVERVTLSASNYHDTINIQGTVAATTVNAGAGNDALSVGPLLGSIQGLLTVNGESNTTSDTLTITDNTIAGSSSYTVSSTQVSRSAVPAFTIAYGTMESLTFTTGNAADTIEVLSTAASTPVTINTGASNDTVHVGKASFPLGNMLGPVTVNGGAGTSDAVQFSDPSFVGGTYTVTPTTVARAGLPTHTYATVESLTLTTTSSIDIINILGTLAATPVTILAGSDNDTITLGDAAAGLGTLLGAVTVDGQAGADALTLNDAPTATPRTFTVTATTVVRAGLPAVTYAGVEELSLLAGAGNDTLTPPASAAGTLVLFDGGGGSNTLRGPDTFSLWLPILQNFGVLINEGLPSGLIYQNVQHLTGGNGDDWFWFASDFAALDGVLEGGRGINDLNYYGYTVPVTVNLPLGTASGVVGGIRTIRNVAGGPGDDLLVGDDQSNVLDGGDGRDVLIGGGRGLTRQPDILLGGVGEDILMAGFTDHDLNAVALDAVRAEWARLDLDYAARVRNLQTGAGGVPVLSAATVHSNQAGRGGAGVNDVQGGAGADFLFLDPAFDTSDWDGAVETLVAIS